GKRGPVRQFGGCVDFSALVAGPPPADHVEILQRESQGVHARMAGSADGILPVPLDLLPRSQLLVFADAFLERGYARWRRRRRRVEDAVEKPLAPENRRSLRLVRREQQNTPLSEKSSALGGGRQRNATKARSDNTGNPIQPRQPFVQIGVVRGEQVQYAAILT